MAKDYYQILGVTKGATPEDIRRAFHKLAHKYHPDKKTGDESRFKEINEAYQILSDEKRRQEYDTYGSADFGASGGGQQSGAWDFGGFNAGQGMQFDLNDLFSEFFGRSSGRGGGRRRGRDISVDIQIPFAEAVFGSERRVLITKIGVCDTCSGTGGAPGSKQVTCTICNGQGKLHETKRSLLGSFTAVRECDTCTGSGKVSDKKCDTCSGYGVIRKSEEVKITIPAGINNDEMIRLSGQGEAAARGGVAGDLYVKVHVENHPTFRRENDDLLMDLSVKLSDAILGTEQDITTLDGKIKVKIPAGISTGEILRVKHRGVPISPSRRGDLHIHIKVKTPEKLSRKAKKLVEDLRVEGV